MRLVTELIQGVEVKKALDPSNILKRKQPGELKSFFFLLLLTGRLKMRVFVLRIVIFL